MANILRSIFSMKSMAVGLFLFLLAIGTATIIESKYGIQTAKIVIYNHWWFELLLVWLTLNMIANIFRYKMFAREKIAMLMFHISFIIIIVGAAITRYVSYEGQMKLPEPQHDGSLIPVDFIYSAEPKVLLTFDDKFMIDPKMYFSEVLDNSFEEEMQIPTMEGPVIMKFVDFKSDCIDSLIVNDTIRDYVLDIVTGGMSSNYLAKDNFVMVGEIPVSFEKKNAATGVHIYEKNGKLMMKTDFPMTYLPMSEMQKARQSGEEVNDSMYVAIPVDTLVDFRSTTLYQVEGQQFVFKEKINHARMGLVKSPEKKAGEDFLTLSLKNGNDEKIITLRGGMGKIPEKQYFNLNGHQLTAMYGSTPMRIPFALACNDFQLDRYPGSDAPSSFASIVSVFNQKMEVEHTQRIFMNHVMDYNGFRFFQSGYYPDESGTILSVNHDYWGTTITYIGYLMMAIGMIMSIFAPIGRMRELVGKLNKASAKKKELLSTLLILVFTTFYSFGEDDHNHNHDHDHSHEQVVENEMSSDSSVYFISEDHAEKLAMMMVQDFDGRTVPFHTVCDKLLRKIHRGIKYKDENGQQYDPVQTIFSMHMYPTGWMNKKIVYVARALRDTLHIKGSYASINDILDENKRFKYFDAYQKAHQKLDKEKSEFDKQLVKLVERYQIIQSFPSWTYMKIIPVQTAENNTWFNPMSSEVIENEENQFKASMEYFRDVFEATHSKDFTKADKELAEFLAIQSERAGALAPSKTMLKLEIMYNKMNIFKNVAYGYILLGFILLIYFFAEILSSKGEYSSTASKWIKRFLVGLSVILFIYHGYGLGVRWYLSGHAPWSNGYEAVVFIAWVTMIAGFAFMRRNGVVLPATMILTFCMIFVTEMNLLDPEITNLQPVLKSYWLMIHVAIITGSYGFLGLGAIISLMNLFLYILRNKKNGKFVTININEITYVSEMTITIGLFMLTIGTFLGGVWANESWGRYWGWDPKEVWALVSVLVYAVILHLRFIPALKSKFIFNVVSFWGYSAIIFTFFGVNFYLVGLHSYAQGDGLGKVPNWIFYTVLCFYILTELAAARHRLYKASTNEISFNEVMKKFTYLFGGFVLVLFFLVITKAMTSSEMFSVMAYTGVSMIIVNLVMFGYLKSIKN